MGNRRAGVIGVVVLVAGVCAAIPFQRHPDACVDGSEPTSPATRSPLLLLDPIPGTSPQRMPLSIPGQPSTLMRRSTTPSTALANDQQPPPVPTLKRLERPHEAQTTLPDLGRAFPNPGDFSEPPSREEPLGGTPLDGETHRPSMESPQRPSLKTPHAEMLQPKVRPESIKSPESTSPLRATIPPDEGATRTHVVRDGDSLGSLAARYFQNSARWPEIYEANRDQLVNPELLPVGVALVIPRPRRLPAAVRLRLRAPSSFPTPPDNLHSDRGWKAVPDGAEPQTQPLRPPSDSGRRAKTSPS